MPLFRRMTEKEALEKTILVWDYLAKHPEQEKIDAYKALHLSPDRDNCPLCEYTQSRCQECLLLDFWPSTGIHAPCTQPDSAYACWIVHRLPAFAEQIADAARTKLEELKS